MATVKKAVAKKAPAAVQVRSGVDWQSLYLYAVCLITLLIVLFSVVSFVHGILNAVFPDPGYVDLTTGVTKATKLAQAQQESNNQRQAFKGMFTSLTTACVAAPLYLYHWKQTKKTN
ncbi:MAG: hypothetical protein F2766_04685 [Actinobacteria bacterium]|uniref:Unannotated protein n=1 Tax=freshwater metagenome TaxID=449393 RepID=A0A6J7VIE2_9ZZZZ|nr:hypothetical protein [Actinomycetota bacterium]MTA73059.1 hypothetical protein [Actinomycetota bacterium]